MDEIPMRPDELIALIRTRRFVPLRIHLSDGKVYEIRHPDQIIVLRGRVDIGVGADPESGAMERVEHVALVQIVRVEEMVSASSRDQ